MRGHTVVCVERVEQGAQDTALWGSYVQGDGVGGELADFHHLRSAGEEILNPVTSSLCAFVPFFEQTKVFTSH